MSVKVNWDGLGIATSLACAIHCAVLPLLLSSLPLFGINIIHNASFEWGMILLAFAIGSFSLLHGFFIHHRSFTPMLIFSTGFFALVLKQLFHSYEVYFLLPAVIFIVSAHFLNFKICRKVKCYSAHHKH